MSGKDLQTLWTVGHSTRTWDQFAALLLAADIQVLVDVRRFAGSRRHPQFSGTGMGSPLAGAGIEYVPMPELGGRRAPHVDSVNTAWRNAGFRGYADYMQTPAYQGGRERLLDLARARSTAVMCAEAMWWQCHRSLIADDFKSAGWTVIHLQAEGRQQEHPYTPAARIVDGRLDYGGDSSASTQPSLF